MTKDEIYEYLRSIDYTEQSSKDLCNYFNSEDLSGFIEHCKEERSQ